MTQCKTISLDGLTTKCKAQTVIAYKWPMTAWWYSIVEAYAYSVSSGRLLSDDDDNDDDDYYLIILG